MTLEFWKFVDACETIYESFCIGVKEIKHH